MKNFIDDFKRMQLSNPRAFCVGRAVDKVTLGQTSIRILSFTSACLHYIKYLYLDHDPGNLVPV
jgi:hypothetical protein